MVNAASPLIHINLLFALLARMAALFGLGPRPPKPVVRALIRAEAALAAAIRATLREDGVAFPDLDDPAFLVWFNQNHPGSDETSRPVRRKIVVYALKDVHALLDRRLPTGTGFAGWKPEVHHARAPP
jgi:hypothetical protein